MRNLTLSLIALGACFLVFTNVQAQADVCPEPEPACEGILFPFENLGCDNDNVDAIGEYMTGVYGSTVRVQDAQLKANFIIPFPWIGKPHGDYYLKTDDDKSMEIFFDEKPITRVQGNGYVFISDHTDAPDFRVVGFDKDGNKVGAFNADTHWFENVPFDLAFDSPVYKLRIRDNYECLVAVDNLCVTPVPVPGAGLLGVLGMGVTGWLKRRKTL